MRKIRILTPILLALFTLFILFWTTAQALPNITHTVCAGGSCDFTSIQAAIDAASSGHIIDLAGETFMESITIDKDLTIIGSGKENTIVQAAASPETASSRVILVSPGVSVTLKDMTIRYGYEASFQSGGGILNQGHLTVNNCAVIENSCGKWGGGIANDGWARSVTLQIISSEILSNTASSGGGVHNYAKFGTGEGTLTIENSMVAHNIAELHGGGIGSNGENEGVAYASIYQSIIANNESGGGGGVSANASYEGESTLIIATTTIEHNSADGAGGGVSISTSYTPTSILNISQSILYNNTATSNGGGVFHQGSTTGSTLANIDSSTFSENYAESGGGIYHKGYGEVSSVLTLTYSTLMNNDIFYSSGGAVYNHFAHINYFGNILANSNASTDCTNASDGTSTDLGYNIDQDGSCISDASSFTDDPDLGPLRDNGGPTWTYALEIGSPAIDAIPPGECTAAVDQRGYARPVGLGCDIGSYEYNDEAWVDDDWKGQSDVDTFDSSLVWGSNAFNSIQPAVNAVLRTVHVLTGTYTESLTINKNLTIIGEHGAPNTIVQAATSPNIATNRVVTITNGVGVTMQGFTIRYGKANNGGGIFNEGTLTLTHSIVISNVATHNGGGINNFGKNYNAVLNLSHTLIAYNEADNFGGGIQNDGRSGGLAIIHMEQSTFSGNSASSGGGLANMGTDGTATLQINYTTFSGNSATNDGGGLGNLNGVIFLFTSILANSPSGGDCITSGGGFSIQNYNIIEDNTCGFSGGSDPLLGPLADNGGDTSTHALLEGSPALNAIPLGVCEATTDQRGFPRPAGSGCDIGAFEATHLFAIYIPLILK